MWKEVGIVIGALGTVGAWLWRTIRANRSKDIKNTVNRGGNVDKFIMRIKNKADKRKNAS